MRMQQNMINGTLVTFEYKFVELSHWCADLVYLKY